MNNVKEAVASLDVSTRGKRRKAVALIIEMLGRVHAAEDAYLLRVPPNLQGSAACEAAGCSMEALGDAIGSLADAY